MYALIDCNNFYASCERVFRPDLDQKPVAVLSNNDGCFVARSNEVKALGVPMGAPFFQYKKLLEKHDAHIFSANFPLYGSISKRINKILFKNCPGVEIYSIDESFINYQGFEVDKLVGYNLNLKETILKQTRIPVGIGIAKTKSLSKLANHIAKKFPEKTGQVYMIDSEEKRIKALKWCEIGDVWGIGKRYAKRLKALGVHNAFEFTKLSDSFIRKEFNIVLLRLKKDLEGQDSIKLDDHSRRKNIACTRTFSNDVYDLKILEERISTFIFEASKKLRQQGSFCSSFTVFIYTNKHKKGLPQDYQSCLVKLPYATDSSIVMNKFAVNRLKKLFKENHPYKKGGVILHEIQDKFARQQNLFEPVDNHSKLMATIDKLNLNGCNIKLGSQDLKQTWKMKQSRKSKAYLTNINDILEV